jgi:glycerol-3-phosphate cytidylyltransferase
LYSHNMNYTIRVNDWRVLHNFFERKYNEGVAAIKSKIKDHEYLNKLNICNRNKYKSVAEVLTQIHSEKVKILNIFQLQFLKLYVYDIKFYYPDIIINYYNTANDFLLPPIYLNKCDNVYFKHLNILLHYKSASILYVKKPSFQLLKLITFGTFDLFHKGHTNIFNQCVKYSNNIIVGLSSDAFTYEKKNIYPTDNFETRKNNIIKSCNKIINVFSEEKMELKNDYIKTHNANLLIMGDDWLGRFDFVDCAVIYEKRTPNISSTMLRNLNAVKV